MMQQIIPEKRKFILVRIIIFYHPDQLGGTSAITNTSGSLVENTFYDPYEAILEGGGSKLR